MMSHTDESGAFAICEHTIGPYGGNQCKCKYATEAERHAGRRACESFGDPDCNLPSHVIGTVEWWDVVLWDEGSYGSPETPCRNSQEIADDELLEFFAPTPRDAAPSTADIDKITDELNNSVNQLMRNYVVQQATIVGNPLSEGDPLAWPGRIEITTPNTKPLPTN